MPSNVERVRQAHESFTARDFDTAEKLVAETTAITDHGRGVTLRTRAEFRGWMEAFVAMSSDIKVADAQYIDGGEWVTARFTATGVQDGPMDPFPVSGKPFSLDVCEVWHFSNGEADEGHNYSDGLGMAMQLGHITPP